MPEEIFEPVYQAEQGNYAVSERTLPLTVGVEELLSDIAGECSVVVWLDYAVIWGRLTGGKLYLANGENLELKYVQEMRIFNQACELYIQNTGKEWQRRYIQDGSGEQIEYVDTTSRLWGEATGTEDGFVKLCDKSRKIELCVPVVEEGGKYYRLRTRNYIQYDSVTGQAGYGDFRFVAVEKEV